MSARSKSKPVDDGTIDVLFVVPPHTLLLDVAGPAEAFRLANQQLVRAGSSARFHLRYCGPQASAESSVGLQVTALEPLPATLGRPTWLMIVGQASEALKQPDAATRDTVTWHRPDSEQSDGQLTLAHVLHARGDDAGTEAAVTRARQLAPSNPRLPVVASVLAG